MANMALATAHADKTFIVYGDRRISFAEFSYQVLQGFDFPAARVPSSCFRMPRRKMLPPGSPEHRARRRHGRAGHARRRHTPPKLEAPRFTCPNLS